MLNLAHCQALCASGRQATVPRKVPSPTVRTKCPDLRPFTVLVPLILGLRVSTLPISKGLGKGSLRFCPSDWKKSDRVTPLQVLLLIEVSHISRASKASRSTTSLARVGGLLGTKLSRYSTR